MKAYLILFVAILFVSSCSKEDSIKQDAERLYPVKFFAKMQFESEESPFKSAKSIQVDTTSNPSYPQDTARYPGDSSLYYKYLVYRPSGTLLKQISGRGSEISDNLPAGNYRIAILGSNEAAFGKYSMNASNYYTDSVDYPRVFSHSFEFNVDSVLSDTESNKVVQLDRKWGEIDLTILDRETCYIPSNVNSIKITVEGSSPSLQLGNGSGIYAANQISSIDKSISEFRTDTTINCLVSYSTQSQVNIYVTLNFTDQTSSKPVLLTSTTVKPGMKTTLKGKLADKLQIVQHNQNLGMVLLDDWANEIVFFSKKDKK